MNHITAESKVLVYQKKLMKRKVHVAIVYQLTASKNVIKHKLRKITSFEKLDIQVDKTRQDKN